ncbi:hypothetical protein AURDEDRAFT_153187 [Auricularia subglabra TFB-10046 SS5]|nr:hypothetical protein AURDEDRAFT_153187 [Auricularia subglabra TFB-10046 SS5]
MAAAGTGRSSLSLQARRGGAPSALLLLDVHDANPPLYSPSATPSPSYSFRPRSDEQTLHTNARRLSSSSSSGRRTRPLLEFTKTDREGGVKLVLQCSSTEDSVPIYARNAIVRGAVQLTETHGVLGVAVRMVGRVRMAVASSGSREGFRETRKETEVLALGADLFSSAAAVAGEEGERHCPALMPFQFSIPPAYEDDRGMLHALPPSYDAHITAEGGIRAGCLRAEVEYSISVVVTKRSKRFFNKTKLAALRVATPFVYRPRTRPSNPPPEVEDGVSAALKAAPDLWTSHARELGPSSSSSSPSSALARSEILLPKSGVFCIAVPIPLHVQLSDPARGWIPSQRQLPTPPSTPPGGNSRRGSTALQSARRASEATVQATLRPSQSELNVNIAHKRTRSLSSRFWPFSSFSTQTPSSLSLPPPVSQRRQSCPPPAEAEPAPRIYLVRRVSVSLGSVRACGAYACGEGVLRDGGEAEIILDQARLHKVPGFRAGGLCVEDFVVVAWGEGRGEHAVPVKLVTDPYPHSSPY